MKELADSLKEKLNKIEDKDPELHVFFEWALALRKENKALREENNYYKSPAYTANLLTLADPSDKFSNQKFKIKSSHKQKSCIFNLYAGDIIKIVSDGKTKNIILENEINSVEGIGYTTNRININTSFDNILKQTFLGHPFLCRANNEIIISTTKYILLGNQLINKNEPTDKIKVPKKYLPLVIRHYEWLLDNFRYKE